MVCFYLHFQYRVLVGVCLVGVLDEMYLVFGPCDLPFILIFILIQLQ